MNVNKILDELRQERSMVEDAILALERLAGGGQRKRGRPPKWMSDAKKRRASGEKDSEKQQG